MNARCTGCRSGPKPSTVVRARPSSAVAGSKQLVTGTPLMMPIPARYLVSMGLPLYTFGGVGGDGAAQ